MALEIKLEAFEGPLDLLLYLIEKNKIDIFDIPIVEITEQYLQYLNKMKEFDLNVASEFMLMAATLIDIKCKMLLPSCKNEEGEEIDPRAELVEKLIQYKIYKHMSYELKDRQVDYSQILFKKENLPDEVVNYKQPIDLDSIISDVTLTKLNKIFLDILRRKENMIDPLRSKFGTIEDEEVSVDDRINYISDYIKKHKKFTFRSLLEKEPSRVRVIVTFLSILELMKAGIIKISQDEQFSEINIEAA